MKFNKLKYDFTIDLATAHSRVSKKWRNRHWQWSELLERCSDVISNFESPNFGKVNSPL